MERTNEFSFPTNRRRLRALPTSNPCSSINYRGAQTFTNDNDDTISTYYKSYQEAVTYVLSSPRLVKKEPSMDIEAVSKCLLTPERLVTIHLPSIVKGVSFGCYKKHSNNTITTDQCHHELTMQGSHYQNVTHLTYNQYTLVRRVLESIGDYCAKHQIVDPIYVAWDQIKQSGVVVRESAVTTYLYVLGLASGGTNERDGEPLYTASSRRTSEEVATYHDNLYIPTEKTTSIRIKMLIEDGDPLTAERLLVNAFPNGDEIRLRTSYPILKFYCDHGDISSALRIYSCMIHVKGVIMEAEHYAIFFAAVARMGYFRPDSNPIVSAEELGYSTSFGSKLFDILISDMAQAILEITNDCANIIHTALSLGFPEIAPFDNEFISCRVTVDNILPLCPRTGVTLRLITMNMHQRKHMRDTLLRMANTQYETFKNKHVGSSPKYENTYHWKNKDEYAGKELGRFAKWLDEREGEPFTALIDGANVAYFGSGFINYHQVKRMVEALEKMGESPLVVMPYKYIKDKFNAQNGKLQTLTPSEKKIIEQLIQGKQLFVVPLLCLDDYYMILASVSNQTKTCDIMDLDVNIDNADKRWPGARPLIVTNDQMKDHKLELLEPHLFRRWFSSHVVQYNITGIGKNYKGKPTIIFNTANVFSREIQGNPLSAVESDGSIVWHFPVKDWDHNDWFCVRIPTSPCK